MYDPGFRKDVARFPKRFQDVVQRLSSNDLVNRKNLHVSTVISLLLPS